jgi:hypothetical protein
VGNGCFGLRTQDGQRCFECLLYGSSEQLVHLTLALFRVSVVLVSFAMFVQMRGGQGRLKPLV